MTLIKICGLRTSEHALAAVEAGADLLGFIFAPARRQVGPADVVRIGQAVRSATPADRRLALVGVFVNEAPERMRAIAQQCHLDAIQLSGDEPVAVAEQLPGLAIIKAIRFQETAVEQSWLNSDLPSIRLLVDAHIPGAYGGAGVVADWDRARLLAQRRPIILAGGLTPANVGAAIERVRPWGVDVSSGVETEGVKDIAKIHAFAAAARTAQRHIVQ
jgi:phosphoribosylanthranilate isomerase